MENQTDDTPIVFSTKQSPTKIFKWNRCDYDRINTINFHEFIQTGFQFQTSLRDIRIRRPFQDSALTDLLKLSEIPTIRSVSLFDWDFQEISTFLQARRHLGLDRFEIYDTTEKIQDSTNVTPSAKESQLIKVQHVTINAFDDWIHKILNCLQKDCLQYLHLSYDPNSIKPLRESVQLFDFENLIELRIDGGNDESEVVSFDFISTTCMNLANLRNLYLHYCFIDPTEAQCCLHMPALNIVEIILFKSQKTIGNEQATCQAREGFILKDKDIRCNILYSDGDDE